MNKSESIKELAVALSKAQSEMPPAEMKSVNPFFKSKYADLGSVIKSASPVLAKHGLSISQMPISDNGNIGLTTILMHSSGEWIESTIFMPLGEESGRSAAQSAGSIITYLRRYSFASALGMYADEDTDGNAPPAQKAKPAKKSTNGNRPYPPEVVRDKIAEVAAFPAYVDYDANDNQRNLLRYGLELCFPGDKNTDDKRHTLLKYIAGTPSTKKVSGGVVKAMLDKWLTPEKDEDTGDYSINPMAIKEAQTIITAALADEGQQALL